MHVLHSSARTSPVFQYKNSFYWRVLWERLEKEVILITWTIKLQSKYLSIWTTRKLNLQKNFLNNLRQFYSLGHNKDVFMDVEEVGYGMWLKTLTADTHNLQRISPRSRHIVVECVEWFSIYHFKPFVFRNQKRFRKLGINEVGRFQQSS